LSDKESTAEAIIRFYHSTLAPQSIIIAKVIFWNMRKAPFRLIKSTWESFPFFMLNDIEALFILRVDDGILKLIKRLSFLIKNLTFNIDLSL